MLQGIHYDLGKTEFLVKGFTKGFRVGHQGELPSGCSKNHTKTAHKCHIVQYKLNKEIWASRIAGPFDQPPLPNFILNPLGLVPKTSDDGCILPEEEPNNPSSYCVITDLCKSGLNACIPKEDATVQYT